MNKLSYTLTTLTESVGCKGVDDKDANFLGRHSFSFNFFGVWNENPFYCVK